MRLAVCGTRTFPDENLIRKVLDEMLRVYPIMTFLDAGGSSPAERVGRSWAKNEYLPVERFDVDWSSGGHAGRSRNRDLVELGRPTRLLVFHDGDIKGSVMDLIRRVEERGKEICMFDSVACEDLIHFVDSLPELEEKTHSTVYVPPHDEDDDPHMTGYATMLANLMAVQLPRDDEDSSQ